MYSFQENEIPIRICQKCKKSQLQLIQQLCDLLVLQQNIKFDFSQQQQYICQKCLRKTINDSKKGSTKKSTDSMKHWKPPTVIKFQKQQRQRQTMSKTKYLSTLTIQILMHFRFKNQNIYSKEYELAMKYENIKKQEQHILFGNGGQVIYPKCVGRENLGDGKVASGYRDDWEKGITQIIEAFSNNTFGFQ